MVLQTELSNGSHDSRMSLEHHTGKMAANADNEPTPLPAE
jgi:hypothetical protein